MPIVYLFCLVFLLTSCTKESTHSVSSFSKSQRHQSQTFDKDGAPSGPIPVHFRAVKPKTEPLSHYGNPDSYAVAGQTYRVMQTSGGYKAKGVASWYGTKFHKKRTSSGDKYDMYAMTAAHRTLPLPTYVKVKNLANGREAIVKVNDRGPFHSNRLIDLSYAAAAKLGVFPQGTAPVEIQAISMKRQLAHYYIQAGAFNSRQLANALKLKLAKITSSPISVENYSRRYVVKVGPFVDKRTTDNLRVKLASQGLKAFSVLQ